MSYQDKYLKYKNKYLLIKKQFSATITDKQQVIIDNLINERPIISNIMEEKINNKMWGGMERNYSLSNTTSAASSAVPIDRSLAASSAAPIGRSLVTASSAVPIDRLPERHTGFIQKEYRDNLFEINNYEEILLHIFNGNDRLGNLAYNNHREIIGLINFIEKYYPTEDKYYFIICINFCFTDSPCDIIEYLIYYSQI